MSENSKLARDNKRLAQGWLLQWQDVKLDYQLARGGYGEVWRGRYRGRWDVAMKKMFDTADIDALTDESEIHFLQRARHPRLVLFMGAGRMPDKNLFLVLEYMEEGSLDTRIESDLKFPWIERLRILGDVAEGMAFLHDEHGSVHRDLKCGNVLLDKEDGLLRGKIADFGMSKFMSQNRNETVSVKQKPKVENTTRNVDVHASMTNGLGTPSNMAPEVWKNMSGIKVPITRKIDVYSYGVMMFEVCYRTPAWRGVKFTHIIQKSVIAGKRPRHVSSNDDCDASQSRG